MHISLTHRNPPGFQYFHDGVVAHPPIDLVDPIGRPLGNERHEVT